MPYIPKEARLSMDLEGHARRAGIGLSSPGELNFVLTTAILAYLGSDPHYRDFNEVIGVLECVKQELYRRMVAPYEDQKCIENGDVYP